MYSITGELFLNTKQFILDAKFNISLENMVVIYGPSGAGKTTFLHCLAGLMQVNSGYIILDHKILQDASKKIFIAPNKRDITLSAQTSYLFPHLNVLKNIKYGYARRVVQKCYIHYEQVIQDLQLADLLDTNINKLSGGQQQLIALARALSANPKLLLLDEPISALDPHNKQKILEYLQYIQATYKIGVIMVHHNIGELTTFSDNFLKMQQGKLLS